MFHTTYETEVMATADSCNAVVDDMIYCLQTNPELLSEKYFAGVVAPIVSEGDIIGSVMMVSDKETMPVGEVEKKLCQSAAGFLGKHMED